MRDKGIAHIGIGSASGENKAVDAIKEAMDSPLLETTVSGATDIIVNFSGNIVSLRLMMLLHILQSRLEMESTSSSVQLTMTTWVRI